MSLLALSELIGTPVKDANGLAMGRVREVAVSPQELPPKVVGMVVRTSDGDKLLPASEVASCGAIVRSTSVAGAWERFLPSDGLLLLRRDLLDQQIIDVHGRKVVRVTDVELEATPIDDHVALTIVCVAVGARGAVRRLCLGIVPRHALRALLERIPEREIPWQAVNLLETDPARRVKLKISYEGLESLHPADIADIVEDLAPAEREAVFESLDEEVAAEALEEIEPDIQKSIVESLDSDRAADIVEEMDPDAAADLLGDLEEDHSGQILKEMEPEERKEVTQLLEFGQHTAAGRMTTDYVSVEATGTVDDAIEVLKTFQGSPEAVANVYLTGPGEVLVGSVPIVQIAIASTRMKLRDLSPEAPVTCLPDTPQDDVAELFDKYNLLTLAVVDDDGRLLGIITADDVISMLRGE